MIDKQVKLLGSMLRCFVTSFFFSYTNALVRWTEIFLLLLKKNDVELDDIGLHDESMFGKIA